MFSIYMPKCKPFYKLSLLALQFQVGLKCDLTQTKAFGLINVKTNIKGSFEIPESFCNFLAVDNEQNSKEEDIYRPIALNSSTAVSSLHVEYDSTTAMSSLESMIGLPAPPPRGYVLWQKQRLREHTDAVGKPLPPHYVEMNGWKYVRIEDLAASDRSPSLSFSLRNHFGDEEPTKVPEELVEQAMVKEYVYTGEREKDLEALHGYIDACNKAIRALDPANRAARTLYRFQLRMNMTILKESLKEELEILSEELDDGGYHSFDDGPVDSAELTRLQMRPKGYRWTCPGWL